MYRLELNGSVEYVNTWAQVLSHPWYNNPKATLFEGTPIGWVAL